MQKHFTIWPNDLQEKTLLDLSIRARDRGQKLACWLPEEQRLVILFDGKRGNSLNDYECDRYSVAPGATLMIDRNIATRYTMKGPPVAGLILDDPNMTLSYWYQYEWGGKYLEKAKCYNKAKSVVDLTLLWDLYANMNFAWFQDHENKEAVQKMSQYFQIFNNTVSVGLKNMPMIHIPLVLDPELLCKMN